jgi:class 3 adenylate cyclase
MSEEKPRLLSDRQVEQVSRRLGDLVETCATCMPYEGGEPVWLGRHWQFTESVEEALQAERIPRKYEEIDAIADQLHFSCPNCGAELEAGCEVGDAYWPEELEFITDARGFESTLVPAIVMFGDVQGFSNWAKTIRKPERIADFLKHFYSLIKDQFDFTSPSLVKLLGDGVMFVWENVKPERAQLYVSMACMFPYDDLVRAVEGRVPDGIRFGFTMGNIVRLTKKDSAGKQVFHDYAGYEVNLACRVQSDAKVGTPYITDDVKKLLNADFKFSPVEPDPVEEKPGIPKGVRKKDWAQLWRVNYEPKRDY